MNHFTAPRSTTTPLRHLAFGIGLAVMLVISLASMTAHAVTAPEVGASAAKAASAAVTTTERAVSDTWITTKVKSEIAASNLAQGVAVSVSTRRGVVTLKGKLANADAVDKVKLIAKGVNGVKSVSASRLVVAAK